MSINRAVAAYLAAPAVMAPLAVAAAQRLGSSILEKSDRVWSVSLPMPIKELMSPAATAEIARAPPNGTKLGTAPLSYTEPAMEQSRTTVTMRAPLLTALRIMPPSFSRA